MNEEHRTTIARTSEKSTAARWEMSDKEIWGMEAFRVTLLNKPSERKIKAMPGVDRAAA